MRLLSKILWLLAFLAATFCWMVLFEHGFTMKGFSQGVREEWQALMQLVSPEKSAAPAQEPPTPKSTPSK
ncbi:MAG TPA: hypothetical protein DIT13_18455 [Verrucomicrobiales bacterium]|nr:hypothetical protein [Verrucomicrobiales bacterium]HRJ08072.1 hypothetical protein [Prosthecobacter sp.]HRK16926.1 hypothetical protein [Prosthecobacter sp.]